MWRLFKENIHIWWRETLSSSGESSGTVFEVLGDFHHSNPLYYKPNDISPRKSMTHKQGHLNWIFFCRIVSGIWKDQANIFPQTIIYPFLNIFWVNTLIHYFEYLLIILKNRCSSRSLELKKTSPFEEFFLNRKHKGKESNQTPNILRKLNQYRGIFLKEKLFQNGPLNFHGFLSSKMVT